MTIIRTSPFCCPICKRNLDAMASDGPSPTPQPGHVTVCIYCAHVCVFGDDLVLREPTEIEAKRFAESPKMQQIVQIVKDRLVQEGTKLQ